MSFSIFFKGRKPSILFGMFFDKLFRQRIRGYSKITSFFVSKIGIEIGGPSPFFSTKGYIPVYTMAQKVDGCNFSNQTVWEGHISSGENYSYISGKYGHQFICEGCDVNNIPKNNYDFILSCNSLEHIANPLKALINWLQLLKDEGYVVLILPRKESNFDHKRPITTFEHILQDYRSNVKEDDLSHIEEILKLHDLKFDLEAGNKDCFRVRSYNNFNNRCLHHHVFDQQLLTKICTYLNLEIVRNVSLTTNHVIIAKK